MAKKAPSLINSKLGLLFILDEFTVRNKDQILETHVTAKCDCGTVKTYRRSNLIQFRNPNCGCIRIEKLKKNRASVTHGYSIGQKRTRAYNIWTKMKQRCLNSKDPKYPYYGGRGITIDSSWLSFQNFILDMGNPPNEHSIDRIDVNGNYCKSNCRWSTNKEQSNNRRSCKYIEFNGFRLTHQQWAERLGFKEGSAIAFRLKSGWTIKQAISTPKGTSRISDS